MKGWFGFGKKNKKSKYNGGFGAASRATACDGTTSASLADAIIFPMQYNGPTYNFNSFPDELLFIPYRDTTIPRHNPANLFSSSEKLNHKYGVTALLIHGNPKNNPTHFMILFHGNGVDLGMASAIWRPLIRALPIHLLIVEYPGYGIMDGKCTCKQVIKVAQHIYQFVTSSYSRGGLNISVDKLIILGRSIGTGPASHIAKQKCHTLILVSPFTSIHNLSKDLMGKWTKWMLPKDYKNGMDDNDNNNHNNHNNHNNQSEYVEYDEEEDEDDSSIIAPNLNKSVSNPLTCPNNNNNNQVTSLDDNNYNNYNNYKISLLKENEENKEDNILFPAKSSNKKYNFVFNNITQIEYWQCKNFMVFHGKNDELIPYTHTNTIVSTIQKKNPQLKPKKFLIDGVGHNDVNIQFIGLRIFMQYQDELQSSFNDELSETYMNNIDDIVPYLDNPPQFDVITNKVQNFNYNYQSRQHRNGSNTSSNYSNKSSTIKKKIKGSFPSVCADSDSDGEIENQNDKIKLINKWNENDKKFIGYRRDLASKVYDLSLKLRLDAQQKQTQKANDLIQTKWI